MTYQDGQKVYFFVDGIGDLTGRYEAATDRILVNGVSYGTLAEWNKQTESGHGMSTLMLSPPGRGRCRINCKALKQYIDEFCEQRASEIYVRECVNGIPGVYALAELPRFLRKRHLRRLRCNKNGTPIPSPARENAYCN
jgi:hypothetical protein